MVAIPTTSGTGSEATQLSIITNTEKDIKMLLKGAVLMPDIAIDDPAFTLTAPKSVTAATGLDALCHASEAYTSRKSQPLTDEFAISAIKKIFKYLPICYNDGSNVEARAQMSLAAFEAGVAFNNASVTVIHGMSRPIGALFHVPHGISNAMLLSACFSYVYDGAYGRFADMARETALQMKKTMINRQLRSLLPLAMNFARFVKFRALKNMELTRMISSLIWIKWQRTLWLPAHRQTLLRNLIKKIY